MTVNKYMVKSHKASVIFKALMLGAEVELGEEIYVLDNNYRFCKVIETSHRGILHVRCSDITIDQLIDWATAAPWEEVKEAEDAIALVEKALREADVR